jgi:CheY-like chemotaxis protein
VLLVDDDASVRETVATLLRLSGHTVVEAAGGAEGIACLAAGPVDVVLTDLGMPEVTGWDVARAAAKQQPGVPVVLLTGWGDQAEGDAPPGVRVDRTLGKPVQRESLLTVISELTAHPAT